jgi:hypothetical protein
MGDGSSDGFNDPAHTEAWQGDDSTDHVSAHNEVIVAEFPGGSHGGVVDVNHDGAGLRGAVRLDRDHAGRLDTLIGDADHDRHPDLATAVPDGAADPAVHIAYRAG